MIFVVDHIFVVVQVNIGIFALPIWESARFGLDETAGLMLVPPGGAFPPLLFRTARRSPTQGHSSPPSLSRSVWNSWLTDLCYHSHCVFVYVSFLSLSLLSAPSLSLSLSLSVCLFLFSTSLFLFPSFCTTGCVKFSCGSERVTFKPGGRRTRFLSTPCLALCV